MALTVVEEDSKVLGAGQIIDLAERRMRKYIARDALYEVLSLYYFGTDLSANTIGVLASTAAGRPLLRDLEKYKGDAQVYSAQRLAPIVDDYQALIGRMPNTRVDPPDSSPQGEEKAVLLTKYLISTHELSDMSQQMSEAGWQCSALGDTCISLEVDAEKRRVAWTVVHPQTAYPEFHRGYKRYQLADLIVRSVEDPDTIHRDYGFMPKSDDAADCTITIYTSAFQRTIVIGTEKYREGPHVEWDLGFCPAQWIFNKVNGAFGQSDIGQSLAQQDFMDFAYNILIDGLVRNTYGTIVGVKNPNNMGQNQIVLGPNAPPIELQEDGDIIVRQIGGDPSAAMKMIDHTVSDINAATGTSQVRQEGSMHSSIPTGRAAHALQGPQGTRIDLKQQNVGSSIRAANSMTLRMQEKAPLLGDHKFEIHGRFKGKAFREEMSGKDIDGWNRNTVTWDAMVGMNLQQREQIATQGKLSGLWDDIRARELMGEDDPIGMRDRIKAMQLHDAEVQGQVQAAMGGAGGAPAPPGGAPGPAGAGGSQPPGGAPAAGGGQPPAPTAQAPITRPPGLAQMGGGGGGLPTGVPQGISRKAVEAALLPILEKLKGTVYAIGELATSGQSAQPQIVVSDHRDYVLVDQTLKVLAPTLRMKAVKEKDLPEDAVRVG